VPRRVYIHVGLQKTGTTYLQQTLWNSRERLRQDGVLVPGKSHQFQRFAFWDLFGRRLRGVDQPRVPGSWQALVEETRQWDGRQVLLSDEFLANARPAHARRMVKAFEPAEVHVVVTVRDLGRVLGSMWQQELSKGRTWPLAEFVEAVRRPEEGPSTAGVAFWLRQDLRKVLGTWETVVPPERIHVVVVPRTAASTARLVELFATATDLDVDMLTPAATAANTSVGVVGTELLRRLNEGLAGRLDERRYLGMVDRVVKPALREGTTPTPIRIPESHRDWVVERSEELIEVLRQGRYDVVGDIDDLRPDTERDFGSDSAEVDDRALADAAITALTATVAYHSAQRAPGRRPRRAPAAGGRQRWSSAARALGYRVKVGVLERADRNAVLARVATLYLRRTRRAAGVRPDRRRKR
jgi:hypothetical protein